MVVLLVGVMAILLLAGACEKSATFDEWSLLAGGLHFLETGKNDIHRDVPAGIKVWIALPAYLFCPPELPEETADYPWTNGVELLKKLDDPTTVLLLARLPIMALSILLALYVFGLARMLWGRWGGLLSLVVICFEPNILAHGRVAQGDMGLAAMGVGGLLFLWKAIRSGRFAWFLLSGIHLALAAEAKYVGFLLWLFCMAACVAYSTTRTGSWKGMSVGAGQAGKLLGCTLLSYLVFTFLVYRDCSVVISGFSNFMQHLERGHATYCLGDFSMEGWWYYYPFTLLVKTPLPVLLGTCLLPLLVRERATWSRLCFLAVSGGGWIAVSMASSVCLGVRHMLFVTASGIIGLGALGLQARSVAWTRLKCMAVGACLVWLAAGTVLYFPDYLAYFNEAAGGKEGGSRLLVDSNLDWGQDLPALARWLEERGNPRIQMIYFGYDSPARFGIRASMLPSRGSLAQLLEPGILAVSATYRVTAPINKGLRAALEKCEYLETLGGTIHLFRVPASK